MRRATEYLFLFSLNAEKYGENADQNNFKCGHFLRSSRITKSVVEYRTYKNMFEAIKRKSNRNYNSQEILLYKNNTRKT